MIQQTRRFVPPSAAEPSGAAISKIDGLFQTLMDIATPGSNPELGRTAIVQFDTILDSVMRENGPTYKSNGPLSDKVELERQLKGFITKQVAKVPSALVLPMTNDSATMQRLAVEAVNAHSTIIGRRDQLGPVVQGEGQDQEPAITVYRRKCPSSSGS